MRVQLFLYILVIIIVMHRAPYPYERESLTRFSFVSIGKRRIPEVVEFTTTRNKSIYNLGFGDLKENGELDDLTSSDNGDIVRVLSTVIHIVDEFIEENPGIKIHFKGSNQTRTLLYERILKSNYEGFAVKFNIKAFIEIEDELIEVTFDPKNKSSYLSILINKMN